MTIKEGTVVEVSAADMHFATNGMEAPTLFVDDIRGAGLIGHVARLNLVENRVDPITNELTHKVVAVLAVPVEHIVNWGPFLSKHFSKERVEKVMQGELKPDG